MNEPMQTIQLPLWLYHKLQALAKEQNAGSPEEILVQLVQEALQSGMQAERDTAVFQCAIEEEIMQGTQ